MKITIKMKKGKALSRKEMSLINKQRIKEFGRNETKNLKTDYPLTSEFIFVKEGKEVVAFGILIPITITFLDKKYDIIGICSIISIKKGKGYGKILSRYIITYLNRKGKTGLGFTLQTKFFKKAGFKTKKRFIKRFKYRNLATGKIEEDNEGDGIFIEGKDKFITKILSTKSSVFIDIPFW